MALTAESAVAEAALAATREALAGFIAAASWKERAVIRSFLDCGEIAVAVALAYDWLYDKLAPAERRAIETAIPRNVLEPLDLVAKAPRQLHPRVEFRDIDRGARRFAPPPRAIGRSRAPEPRIGVERLRSLGPGWGLAGGLSYWSLAMRYAGLMVAALESALGDSFGLADRPGFAQTGDLALHAVGPFGEAFNFGDSEHRFDVTPLAWLARRFGRPIDSWLLGEPSGWHLPFTTI